MIKTHILHCNIAAPGSGGVYLLRVEVDGRIFQHRCEFPYRYGSQRRDQKVRVERLRDRVAASDLAAEHFEMSSHWKEDEGTYRAKEAGSETFIYYPPTLDGVPAEGTGIEVQ